jgi:hypothetical protein
LTVRVASDSETDRILSMRASSLIPLPPEVCLADPMESRGYFRMAAFYGAYGLGSHPVVALLKDERVGSMMASALSRADHLDRVSHYGAWLGRSTVVIEDLAGPTVDDPSPAGRGAGPGRPQGGDPEAEAQPEPGHGPPTGGCRNRASGESAASAGPSPRGSAEGRGSRGTNRPGGRRQGARPGGRRPPSQRRRSRRFQPLLRRGASRSHRSKGPR